jgi:hypothetical protein
MVEKRDWGLVGYGNVGQELARRISDPATSEVFRLSPLPAFVVRSSGIMTGDGQTPSQYQSLDDIPYLPEVNFVALPSTKNGEPAFSLIAGLLEQGKKVVTAEKGALANHFAELRDCSDNFQRLGINAAVGGGTKLMKLFKHKVSHKEAIGQIHLNPSGTKTAARGLIRLSGIDLDEAVEHCKAMGYAEPNSSSPHDTMRNEAQDVWMKAGIFFNHSGLSEEIFDWRNLRTHLSDELMTYCMDDNDPMPYIVSFYRQSFHRQFEHPEETGIVGKSSHFHDGWKIVAGYRDTNEAPILSPLDDLDGPANGFVVGYGPEGQEYTHTETGEDGAGAVKTCETMLGDYAQVMTYQYI